jgi:hypothetical protein
MFAINIESKEHTQNVFFTSFEELKNIENRVAWFLAELCKAQKGVQKDRRNQRWTELLGGGGGGYLLLKTFKALLKKSVFSVLPTLLGMAREPALDRAPWGGIYYEIPVKLYFKKMRI